MTYYRRKFNILNPKNFMKNSIVLFVRKIQRNSIVPILEKYEILNIESGIINSALLRKSYFLTKKFGNLRLMRFPVKFVVE
jgi:hypothetical protein